MWYKKNVLFTANKVIRGMEYGVSKRIRVDGASPCQKKIETREMYEMKESSAFVSRWEIYDIITC